MQCPFCGEDATRVVDSRLADEGRKVRRRRECPNCQTRFTTFESAELHMPRIIKNDGTPEPFDVEKLRRGIIRALYKRPVTRDAIEGAIGRIQRRLRSDSSRDVASGRIGQWVMDELRELDQVAYVRFASVYRQFEDVQAFREEIERLETTRPASDDQPISTDHDASDMGTSER